MSRRWDPIRDAYQRGYEDATMGRESEYPEPTPELSPMVETPPGSGIWKFARQEREP